MTAADPTAHALPRVLEELSSSPAFREAIVGMAVLASDFTILRVNDALATSLGYHAAEMERMPPERFTHPDDAASFSEHLARAAGGATALAPFRKRCLMRGGGRLLCDLHFTPVGGGARPEGWLCQIQDVSAVERAQAQLERERQLFVGGPVVVFRWTNAPGWPVEYVSPNVKEALGWDAGELASGQVAYAELLHPDDRQRVAEEIVAHSAAGRTTYEQIYRLRHRDGSWRWIRDFTVTHADPEEGITHLAGYVFDDTARVEAERVGAAHEADLQRLLRLSRRALAAQSYDELAAIVSEELQERLHVSHALFYRFEAAEPRRARLIAVAGPVQELVRERAATLEFAAVPLLHEVAAADEPVYHHDVRAHPRTDAEVFRRLDVHSVLAAPLVRAGEALGTLWTGTRGDEGFLELSPADREYFRNLAGTVALAFDRLRSDHEGRAAQTRLRQVEKLEAVGQLAGGVAHNFNNALTVILGHASLLLDGAPAGSPLRASLEAILRAGEGSAKAVSQLLQFARPDPGKGRERIEPGTSLAEFAKMLRAVLDESIRLVVRCDEDLPAVAVEGGAFTMILMNLVLNARDAMTGGGRLAIRATVELREGARWLRLEVEDDGRGMSPEVQSRIFEPFFTTKGEQGTGLGLPAVYGAVTRAGGTIEVRSAPDQGTCFTIRLPATADLAEGPADAAPPSPGRERRVLIVEDEEAVRGFAARALRAQGYRVETVANARAALELLLRAHFDLVLADVVMHGMDGFALARKLGATPGAPPVLLMSGYPGGESSGELPAQARGLLRKPFTAQQLAAAIEQALLTPVSATAPRGAGAATE
jgi:PAS domain S-box-containing protein